MIRIAEDAAVYPLLTVKTDPGDHFEVTDRVTPTNTNFNWVYNCSV
jgi:hypothetical protein